MMLMIMTIIMIIIIITFIGKNNTLSEIIRGILVL